MNGTLRGFLRRGLSKAVMLLALLGLLPRFASAQVGLPPSILAQPLDITVLKDTSLAFTVVVSSLTAVNYQWYKDGTPISGATGPIYTTLLAGLFDQGNYWVVAVNSGGSVTSRVARATVLGENDIPLSVSDRYAATEDTTLTVPAGGGVLANDTDTYPGGLIALLETGPNNGTLTLSNNGGFSYTPATNFNGTDSFTYRAWDGQYKPIEDYDVGTKAQVVQKGQPGAQSFSHGVDGDADYYIRRVRLYLSREATAPDTNLIVSIGTGINSGMIGAPASVNPLSITNTSNGSSFQPYDIIFPQAVGPLTAGVTYFLNLENEAANNKDVKIAWPDADGYVKGGYYKNGAVGTKDIRFILSDLVVSDVALVAITVAPTNDAPLAVNDTAATLEDTTVEVPVLLNDNDVDSPAIWLANAYTTNGTVSINETNVVFTPATNFNGTVVLSYVVTDGALLSTGKVTVTVSPVNDAPFALNDSTNTLEDVSVTIRVLWNDYDVEKSPLTVASVLASNGTAVINGTNVVFTPAPNFNGIATLSYVVSDGTASATGSVTITVAAVNDAPVAINDSITTAEDTSIAISVLANDTDWDSATLTIASVSTTNGTAAISGTNVVFTPATNYNGAVVLSYAVTDGALFATGRVSVTVTPVNDKPIPVNDTTNTVEDTSVTIRVLANDSDVDSASTSLTEVSTTNGTALVSGTNVVFTPATNYNGTVTLNYVISDGALYATGKVTVTVSAVNDAPVAVNDVTTTPEDTALTIPVLLNDYDVDSATLTITSISPTNGTAVISGTNVVFTPATNFNGAAAVRYTISDGTLSATGLVTIAVTAVNDAPIARTDSTNLVEDTTVTIAVLANDSDVEASPLTVTGVFTTNGAVRFTTTNITFTPATNYNGTLLLGYVVSDGSLSSTGIVVVTVTSGYDAPVAMTDTFTMSEDSSATIPVTANDYNPDGSVLSITSVTTTNGTAAVSGTNVLFSPAANYFGDAKLFYVMTDGTTSSTSSVIVTVIAVNDPPVALGESFTTLQNTPLSVLAPGLLTNDSDVESSKLSAVISKAPDHGTLDLNADGSFVYTPESNYFGADSFTYKAFDGAAQSAAATVSLNVVLTNNLRLALDVVSNSWKVAVTGPYPAVYTLLVSSNNTDWVAVTTNTTFDGSIEYLDTVRRGTMCFYQARVGTQATTVIEGNSLYGGSDVDCRESKKCAQSFRHGTAGGPGYSVSKIVLHVSRSATVPNAPLNVSIGTTLNGTALAGTAVAINTATITNSSAGASFQTYEIVYDRPINLTAGTTYYLNFDCEAANNGRIYFETSGFSTAYSSGTFYRNNANQGEDAVFEIWGQ